ncbi:MAG: hypothetical protein L0322_31715, partial [Chloroflexi bacterium]|nr:hypothetical protein [Chloroflexota bacterium]
PIYEIGRQTCTMLIDLLNGRPLDDSHVLLIPRLIVRESSGSPLAPERRFYEIDVGQELKKTT